MSKLHFKYRAPNLVPRSLVGKAEAEIWQNLICTTWSPVFFITCDHFYLKLFLFINLCWISDWSALICYVIFPRGVVIKYFKRSFAVFRYTLLAKSRTTLAIKFWNPLILLHLLHHIWWNVEKWKKLYRMFQWCTLSKETIKLMWRKKKWQNRSYIIIMVISFDYDEPE